MLTGTVFLAAYFIFVNVRDFIATRKEMQELVQQEWNRQSWNANEKASA